MNQLRRVPGEWTVCAIVLIVYAVYLPLSGYGSFYYDGATYLQLSHTFGASGHFDLLHYADPLRGYAYPLTLRGLQWVGSILGLSIAATIRTFNAFVIALLGTVLFPRLAKRLCPRMTVTPWRTLALNALIFLFWRDFLNFPLTDVPAITFICGVLLLVMLQTWWSFTLAGVLGGLALNYRPAYLAPLVLLLPFVAFRAIRADGEHRLRAGAGSVALLLAGFAIALAPQIAIDDHAFHSVSPFPPATSSLESLQLTGGMRLDKYETTIDPRSAAQVYFRDPGTQRVMAEAHIAKVSNYPTYARLLLEHPLAMAAGLLRRLFDGIDVEYSSPYVRNIDGDRSWVRSLLLYTLFFLAANVVLRSSLRRRLGKVNWPLAGLWLLPAATALTSAVEVRFFLPLTLLIYALVCFTPVIPAGWGTLDRARRCQLAVVYLVFVIACFGMADSAYAWVSTTTQLAL
jgi:hypothetical protein